MAEIREIRDSSFLEDVCSIIKSAHEAEYKSTGLIINTSNITAEQLLEEITNLSGGCFVATVDGKAAGTLSIFHDKKKYWFSQGSDCLTIKYVAVDPLYQGKHIASDLIEYSKSIASREGQSFLMVSTDQRNKHAISLYQKNGFRIVDVTRGKKAKSNAVRMAWWPVCFPFSDASCQIRVTKGKIKCFLKQLIRF